VALQEGAAWRPAIKIADSPNKMTNPGLKQAWRIYDQRGQATADLVTLEGENPREEERITLRHPGDHSRHRVLRRDEISAIEPLLVEVLRAGSPTLAPPTIEAMRELRRADVEHLDTGVRRIMNPHIYHVSLSQQLWDLKQQLLSEMGV
jgi:nicotinate phosphoribosyltransferase